MAFGFKSVADRGINRNTSKNQWRGIGTTARMVSGGFSFDDGEQVLVSVQKPLGILLEQDDVDDENVLGPVIVAEVDPSGSAGRAGVQAGDILVAIQNASVEQQSLEYAMDFLQQTPRVVNLRFIRPSS
ncbi:expressed unknown protein [Seminavis robusta]|uniref:PDZ domain-containing protein n=1 Tax=Seminavis robusta TaxID=568900 RepID=A0A9N8HK14_9STRA|nr:expressed unknown protein [Seminavis robusta]|eukprot:Sro699_g189440.1 n/a (129) ;mRNA; f:20345-20731